VAFFEHVVFHFVVYGLYHFRVVGIDIRHERLRHDTTCNCTKSDVVAFSQAADIFGARGAWQSVTQQLVLTSSYINLSGYTTA